jgi:3-phosphoshikimate 1-carboxyvinyltransferase
MSAARVPPGVLSGTVRAPPSKSYTHRALVAGHLCHAKYRVERPLDADDTRTTARGLEPLGSRVQFGARSWTVSPVPSGTSRVGLIDCGESGTSLRFLSALAGRADRPIRLRGRGRLPRRPLSELLDALVALGATCSRPGDDLSLPVTIRGPLHGGRVRLDASLSSQFASALLLVLPTVPGDSTLELVGPIVSEPYIEATLSVLRYHRIRFVRRGRRFALPGGQRFRGRSMSVPGDASSAAYFWVAGAITGGPVRVTGIPSGWPQADLAILDVLRSAGAAVQNGTTGTTVAGGALQGFSVDLTSSPDLYPLAGILAACIPALSRLGGAAHVALKESDRRDGTRRLVRAMGAEVRSERGDLVIRGRDDPRGFALAGLSDHRMVMSAAIAALRGSRPSSIADARSVSKSFPGFWNALESLRESPRP